MPLQLKFLGLLAAAIACASAQSARAQAPAASLHVRGAHGGVGVSLGSDHLGASLTFAFDRDDRGRHGDRKGRRERSSGRRYGAHLPPRPVWVPGHYEKVPHQVWVPGAWRDEWVPPVFETRCDYTGRPIQVLVRAGYWTRVQEPGCYVTRYESVWVPGCWTYPRR